MKIREIGLVGFMVLGGVTVVDGSDEGIEGYEFHPGHYVGANIRGVTDYVFRGNSQTDGGPAIQGGFDYKYPEYNLYAGVWASNVSSNYGEYLVSDRLTGLHALSEEGLRDQYNERGLVMTPEYWLENTEVEVLRGSGYEGASLETDFYVGWRPEIETEYVVWDFDLGYKRYQYFSRKSTDNNNLHTNEFYGGLGVSYNDYFRLGYKGHYSDAYFGIDSSAWYHLFNLDVPLDRLINYPGFTFHANYGMTRYGDNFVPFDGVRIANISTDAYDVRYADLGYDDYGVGVRYEVDGWVTDLAWVERSDKNNCVSPFSCNSKAVFSVGKSF